MDTLQKRVDEALDTTVFEGGRHHLMMETPDQLAAYLCTFLSDFSNEEVEDLTPCVEDYQRWYRDSASVL
jgi:hypothetical protein